MRDIILNNFWWKVTALLLAVLAWLGSTGMRPRWPGGSPEHHLHIISHPITISKPAVDKREFKVTPAEVDITLVGNEKVVRALTAREVRAEVLTSDYKEGTNSLKITVFVPGTGIRVERLVPERVQVEVLKQ